MNYRILKTIKSPQDVKKLPLDALEPLCAEIRDFLIRNVSKTGGHLASNLGAVELTVAIYRSMSPDDRIVFDVGHQCYTHKLLTGRMDQFGTLRQLGGISGFPNPKESQYDSFVAGHGSTSLSVAIGIARAKKIINEPGKVFALIGDGAFTGGMVYEGMNNIAGLVNLIFILNDNKMSISKNVGQVAHYLTNLRTNPEYYHAKENMERVLDGIPVLGRPLKSSLQTGKKMLRRQLYHSTFFEEMGFQYIGPVNGHDVRGLTDLFQNIRIQAAPIFVHAETQKGKGFKPAEENPGEFHGVSSFDLNNVPDPEVAPKESFSTQFGHILVSEGEKNNRICAVTAAMKYGTGLQFFYHTYPKRFFDVGMAEEHAVSFAGGLSSQGMLPVVAIYSTFFQRAYDQLIHDISLMHLNAVFAVDRAGLVPGDGETHQGIYDAAFFSQIGFKVISPCNYAELRYWLPQLLQKESGPRVIRYPRGGESAALATLGCSGNLFDVLHQTEKPKLALIAYGSETEDVLEAAELLNAENIQADVIKLTQISPLPQELIHKAAEYSHILFAEESVPIGSIGEQLAASLCELGWKGKYQHIFVDTAKITHATVPQLKKVLGLDAAGLVQAIKEENK